jgi:hypothetical protein
MKRHKRIEDWCDRTADIAWAELVEIKDDDELVAALEQLRQAAVKVRQVAYARIPKAKIT